MELDNDSNLSSSNEGYEYRICDFPDDLLVEILRYIPTKDAVATCVLSKRWRYLSTMLPELSFEDEGSESLQWFMRLHNAPKLECLSVEFGSGRPGHVDVGKWVEKAVNRGVKDLIFKLQWIAELTSFPMSLYTCDTLVDLTLSDKILVDVSPGARLPSLVCLSLINVVYEDEDSLVRLLSSSHVLRWLKVHRHEYDNLTKFTVKVSSLETLIYDGLDYKVSSLDLIGSLVIDSPALTYLDLYGIWEEYCLIENMPCLDEACIAYNYNTAGKFMRSLSSVIQLDLFLTESMASCLNVITFPRLIEFVLYPDFLVDWLEPLISLLQNSPKLKTLTIDTETESLSRSWNQPSSVPGCLSSHLEVFRWSFYRGREDEKQLVTYILANSKCLKTVEISFKATTRSRLWTTTSILEKKQREIESMPRISTSSHLLFPTEISEI